MGIASAASIAVAVGTSYADAGGADVLPEYLPPLVEDTPRSDDYRVGRSEARLQEPQEPVSKHS